MKYAFHSLVVTMLAVMMALGAGIAYGQQPATDTISVTGLGEVNAEPDQAKILLTISSVNQDVNLAKAEADKKYQAVIDSATKQGLKRTDIKSSGISLQPEYQWRNNTQNLIGTRVSRSLTLTVNEIDRVAALLQRLVENNVSTLSGVQTSFKDRKVLERQALTAAIADAKDKATFLAQQFNKKLGATHTISEHVQQAGFQPFSADLVQARVASAEVPQERFGTQSIKARINVVFHAN